MMHGEHLQGYYQDPAVAQQWFAGPWQDSSQWAQWPLQQWQGDRQALAAIASAAVKAAAGDRQAQAHATALGRDNVIAVLAGQQPAYALGPLYNLLKAAHCIAIAEQLSQQGHPAVPVFWCASDDHDHDEAAGSWLIQGDGRLRSLRRSMSPQHCALHRVAAQPGWQALLEALAQLPGSHLGKDWMQALHPHNDETLGAWMCRALSALSQGTGLVCIEAWRLRPLWQTGIQRALEHWPQQALLQRQQQLQAAGWPTPLGTLEQPPLFADTHHQRKALSPDEAHELWLKNPLSLSPGAALRPVLQQLALPAAIYCAGPGEITYHAALGPLYATMGAHAPRLIPRLSLGLIPPWVQRGLDAWGLHADALQPHLPLPQTNNDASDDAILAIYHEAEARLASQAAVLDPQRHQRVETARQQLRKLRHRLERSLQRAQRQRLRRPSIGSLREQLYPRGAAQDRTLSSSQALYQWGPGIFQDMLQQARQHPLGGNQGWIYL
ncbi:MAG: bacillithiol biosynthesis BshC [Planctomycetota bacterium]|nr:MAG: bacillithiol biosynthesis BshC [Planctomycetota bacterium]